MPEATQVNAMFGRIAERYDLANQLLSFGIDRVWRDRLVDEVEWRRPKSVVDLATGSGDVAFALSQALPDAVEIKALDFCEPMIEQAKSKQRHSEDTRIEFSVGDILSLPIESAWADAITIAFGYRNLENRATGLSEMKRVLKPKTGHLFVLEFSQPHPVYRPFYYYYLKTLLPNMASLITGDKAAYEYLSESIEAFPDRNGISEELRQAGFTDAEAIPLAFGSVALHIAKA